MSVGARRCIANLFASSLRRDGLLPQIWIPSQVREHKYMKIILTENIKGLGNAGQIVRVAPGYARNYLCPQLKAMPAIDKYVNLVKLHLKHWPAKEVVDEAGEAEKIEKEKAKQIKDMETILTRLDTRHVVIRRKTREQFTFKKPLTKQDILAHLKKQLHIELAEVSLDYEKELTSIGEFEVPLRLPQNLRLPGGKERLFLKLRIRRAV